MSYFFPPLHHAFRPFSTFLVSWVQRSLCSLSISTSAPCGPHCLCGPTANQSSTSAYTGPQQGLAPRSTVPKPPAVIHNFMVLLAWDKLNRSLLDGNLVCHLRLNGPLMCISLPHKFALYKKIVRGGGSLNGPEPCWR